MKINIESREGKTLSVLEGSRDEISAELDALLIMARRIKNPERRERAEDNIIRAMSYLDATPGAEHQVRTGRRKAGGGKMVKGS